MEILSNDDLDKLAESCIHHGSIHSLISVRTEQKRRITVVPSVEDATIAESEPSAETFHYPTAETVHFVPNPRD